MAPGKINETEFDVVDLDAVVSRSKWPLLSSPISKQNGGVVVVEPFPVPHASSCYSLGTGSFPVDGDVCFSPSPATSIASSLVSTTSEFSDTESDEPEEAKVPSTYIEKFKKTCSKDIEILKKTCSKDIEILKKTCSKVKLATSSSFTFRRRSSSYMRTSDLEMDDTIHSGDEEPHPNYHHASTDPPPGVDHDPKESWVALDNGDGKHAPIAPYAVESLAKIGISTAMNKGMWTPNRPTEKAINKCRGDSLAASLWQENCRVRVPKRGDPAEKDVFVWSGLFSHGLFGSTIPVVRSEGVVNMSPEALVDLIVDSNRVKEYNKLSLGRTDLLVLQDDLFNDGKIDGPFGRSVTKIMQSVTKPPLMRKTLQFTTLLYGKELECGNGYILVTRAVTRSKEDSDSKAIQNEILMGVNVIRRVEGDDQRCVMINVNHLYSPMVPMMLAKKVGSSAAVGFVNDIRACC